MKDIYGNKWKKQDYLMGLFSIALILVLILTPVLIFIEIIFWRGLI